MLTTDNTYERGIGGKFEGGRLTTDEHPPSPRLRRDVQIDTDWAENPKSEIRNKAGTEGMLTTDNTDGQGLAENSKEAD
jgi:hypothetical protein